MSKITNGGGLKQLSYICLCLRTLVILANCLRKTTNMSVAVSDGQVNQTKHKHVKVVQLTEIMS